jgi:uncharacterized protein involved in outer membrane biogenesis
LALTASLTKAEADALAQLLGAEGGKISGRLDGGTALDLTGKTLGAALKSGRGAAILRMNDGDIARDLVERISLDLRNLFREGKGRVPVGCLIAVLSLKDSVGVLSPLRLESREATLVGAGTIDFVGQRLDLRLKTERDTTGFFALDAPIAVTGHFAKLHVMPIIGADTDRLNTTTGDVALQTLPGALNKLAADSDCAK